MNTKFRYPFLRLFNELGAPGSALTLVGGWVPTVYFEYLWKNQKSPFVTEDIDFALDKNVPWKKDLEHQINLNHFKQRHLRLGKERPYQLIFENSPVDFLADESEAKYIQSHILGAGIILHATPHYRFLLEDKISVSCDGVSFSVPRPVRYILHKISVGLQNLNLRSHDIATAYYVLTRSPVQKTILDELRALQKDSFYKEFRKQLASSLNNPGLGLTRKVVAHLQEMGMGEDENDVKEDLSLLL